MVRENVVCQRNERNAVLSNSHASGTLRKYHDYSARAIVCAEYPTNADFVKFVLSQWTTFLGRHGTVKGAWIPDRQDIMEDDAGEGQKWFASSASEYGGRYGVRNTP
jgi:hypothetical protein